MRELSLHILDIIQNSIAASAELVKVVINEQTRENKLIIQIIDDGIGMDKEKLEHVIDPFVTSRTTRKVGLGLPLLKEAARRCDGDLEIKSRPGHGTEIKVNFKYDHIDRAPLGDIVGTMISLIAVNPDINFEYHHIINNRDFKITTCEIKHQLDDVRINHPGVLKWIEDYFREGLQELRGGE